MDEFKVTNKDEVQHTFYAVDSESARHWVINHLDLSELWILEKVKRNNCECPGIFLGRGAGLCAICKKPRD